MMTGVVGCKPTQDAVDTDGVIPLSRSFDTGVRGRHAGA